MIIHTNILNSINLIKAQIRGIGVKREGTGNFSNIYSEAQLIKIFNDANKKLGENEKITITHLASTGLKTMEIAGKIVLEVTSQFIISVGEHSMVVNVTGSGSDRNDASFAQGKALTYTKRYFYSKLLDLPSADLEPEDPSVMLKEVRTSLKNKIDSDTEKVQKFLAGFKAKFNQDFNINGLSLNDLIKYDSQL